MPFTTNISGVAAVDDSIVLAYDQAFIVANQESDVMDQFATVRLDINAKSIQFPRYSLLAAATTPLTEDEDVVSAAMVDAAVLLTPAEYGNVVTTSKLASLQTGGTADLAAATLVGLNAAKTSNKLACLALDASSNVWSGTAGNVAAGSVGSGEVITGTMLNKIYNKLSRASVPGVAGMEYVLVAHDDVINDLRAESGWIDVAKYQSADAVLRNEIGMYKGFRIIRNNEATYADQTGAGTVDEYLSYAFGFNALGKAVSKPTSMVATGPYDKLNRFVNLGWHGVFQYKIVEQDAVWTLRTASSVGVNA